MQEEKLSCLIKFTQAFKTDPFGPLVLLLERNGLLTERCNLLLTAIFLFDAFLLNLTSLNLIICKFDQFRIREEFKCGEEYWALERKLCCALMSNKEVPSHHSHFYENLLTLIVQFCKISYITLNCCWEVIKKNW